MKSQSFGDFQIGIVDNPTIEDKGGFEFASGMDIFSEPGVLKANYAMVEASYGTGASPTALPRAAFFTNSPNALYVAMGSKILINTAGTFNVYLTDSQGTVRGMAKFGSYMMYASSNYLGRADIAASVSGQNDTLIDFTANPFNSLYHPMKVQGGTLKVGSGRYVHSISEAFAATFQALKLKDGSNISSLANHFNNLYIANANGDEQDSSVYGWGGTVLSSGSALPDSAYEMTQRGMQALFSDSRTLFAFPDRTAEMLTYDGAGFPTFRKLYYLANKGYFFAVQEAIDKYNDTIVFAGQSNVLPGIYQMKNGVACQGFVPAGYTPGVDALINVGFVKRGASVGADQRADLYVGYYKDSDASYHIEHLSTNRQNNAVMQTLWHRVGTDKFKRWGGVKLNLKPLATNTSVKVEYRTDRGVAFTDPSISITPSNQDKPAIFSIQPRSKEIQFRFTYTTSTTNTPELTSYDPLFEVLNTVRK
jgi:hypothetical protein